MMQIKNGVVMVVAVGLCVAGPQLWADGPKQDKPAKVVAGSESQLNRIVLTEKAVKRIGIVLVPVKEKPVQPVIRLPGQVVSRPGTAATLSAPMAGTLVAPKDGTPIPGTTVAAGDVILRLRPVVAPSRHVLVDARRLAAGATASYERARKAAARSAQMLEDGAGDQATVERAQEQLAVAKAARDAAVNRIRQLTRDPLRADVSLPIRAPKNGVVLRLFAAPGQVVASGQPIVEVTNLNQLWVQVSAYVGLTPKVDLQAAASLIPLGTTTRKKMVSHPAPPVPSPDGTMVALTYTVTDPKGLVPGSRVMAELPLRGTAVSSITVPTSAVFYDSSGTAWVYLALDAHTFERRRVEIQSVVGKQTALRRGPRSGSVVSVGAMELFGVEFGAGK